RLSHGAHPRRGRAHGPPARSPRAPRRAPDAPPESRAPRGDGRARSRDVPGLRLARDRGPAGGSLRLDGGPRPRPGHGGGSGGARRALDVGESLNGRLFRNGGFRSLWLGQLVSIFGDRLHYLAILSLLVERAHDPRNPAPELALVPLVSFLPTILVGPMAGALVDGWDTRRVLVVSDFLRGCIVLLMIPAVGLGGLPA